MKNEKDLSAFLYNIGMQLYRAREEAGMSRSELQEKTEIGRNTISRYENGTASPTLRILAVMAEALGCEVRVDLVKKEDDHENR